MACCVFQNDPQSLLNRLTHYVSRPVQYPLKGEGSRVSRYELDTPAHVNLRPAGH